MSARGTVHVGSSRIVPVANSASTSHPPKTSLIPSANPPLPCVCHPTTRRVCIYQATIEQAMEKRSKDKFGPLGGKQLVIFLDDFNMPMRISHESPFQPPLELLRFWMDYGGW